MEAAIYFESIIPVLPLNLAVRVEKVLSFHRLIPFLNSMNLACRRFAASDSLVFVAVARL
jgi:hypothetical protein